VRHVLQAATLFMLIPLVMGTSASADDSNEFSEANQALFLTPHFENVDDVGVTLSYRYERSGDDVDQPFTDEITVVITDVMEDHWRSADVSFFSGERERYFPPLQRARGNPVLTAFLQHDITRQGEQTNAPARHLQNRIKTVLEEDFEIRTVKFSFNGEEVEGREIVIEPYRDDPYNGRYPRQWRNKTYTFVVSEQVPGMVYSIRAELPDAARDGYRYRDVLTLDSVSGP